MLASELVNDTEYVNQ